MPTLKRIACFQDRRDEVPNQELARDLAASRDQDGIHEIAENLAHENSKVQSGRLKVLYEIGYIDPTLIAPCAEDLLGLLHSKNNRLVGLCDGDGPGAGELASGAAGGRAGHRRVPYRQSRVHSSAQKGWVCPRRAVHRRRVWPP